ncbi:cysteine hydrolase family protein [Campylobacter canadensis]|uniref:Cysteine hydrolase n=1 Tax=Campylobacter canadensis TaxID=449520 RepID=A0ABS7WRH7_9BACT|nr:isochorismatase family cysteine hydrolase [Campylobacter canadensis]MBZ7986932.1 cysteine hydrolase [Campylobacter canadensis]MBZ7997968.1 cysteine hydrolase [Campylobacter canadensis]
MKKILIVIDIQNDFLDGALACDKEKSLIQAAKQKIFSFDGEVIYTQDTHYDDYLDTNEGKHLPITHCIKNSKAWQIPKELLKENAKIFEKNSFCSLELANYLKSIEKEILSIEIIGICTDICVLSNAILLKAFLNNTEIYVHKELTRATSLKNHEEALNMLRQNHINVI